MRARRTSGMALAIAMAATLVLVEPAAGDPRHDLASAGPERAPATSTAPVAARPGPAHAPGAGTSREVTSVAGSLVVRTDGVTGPTERAEIAGAVGGVPAQVVAPDTFVVRVPEATDLEEPLAEVAALAGVETVQRELVYQAAEVEPDDTCWRGSTCTSSDASPSLGGQIELRNVGAPGAWEVTTGSAEVVVAVLDTKIETSPPHRDLVGKLAEGTSFVGDRSCDGPVDARDHGTIAAGLIAARPGNGIDMAGLGWDTRVLPVEVLDDCGSGTTSGVAAGLRWAADDGADIINLSLTGAGRDPAVSSAIAYARSKGALVVAAAGNQGSPDAVYPAAELGVVAVAATGLPDTSGEDRLAPFSNFGSWVDIAAPGTDVIGLRRVGGSTGAYDGTARATGTSFATPLVAAAAALVLAEWPEATAEEVAARIAQTAAPVAGTGVEFLWGRLDVAAALGPLPLGYRLTAADGGQFGFGDAPFAGSGVGGGTAELVGAAAHVSGRGYWLARADGQVDAFGSAPRGGVALPPGTPPVIGIAGTPGGDGWWLATRDGRVVPGGNAPHLGSEVESALNQPIVGLAAGRRGDGYWLVARDGGIFAFGSAAFFGSTGDTRLNEPIVGMAATTSGAGYWLVARDGGIFSFGDATFFGSTGATTINRPIVGMATTPSGRGYWLVASDGGIFSFGDAEFLGSTGATELVRPIVAMTPR